jgi:hypothetical protein
MANLKAEITLEWGDGIYDFALKMAQIEELEHLCDEGIGRIAARVFSRVDFSYRHIRETIRLGLIGGGLPAIEAARLTKIYVDGVPIDTQDDKSSPLKTANAVLQAVYFGWADLPEVEPSGEAPSPEERPTSGSTGRRRGAQASARVRSAK